MIQLTSMSNPFNASSSRRKLIKEEIELRDRDEKEISRLWKIVPVISYFVIVVAGITTSITIGSLLAAFDNNCVLYARITVRGLDEIVTSGENLTLYEENIVTEQYGSLADCTFSEYCSAASAIFGGIWGIIFLQCGRGGVTSRSISQSWRIVPPALVTNVVFFVLSCVIFAKTIGGLSFFCNHLRSETNSGELAENIRTCEQILSFQFPDDIYNTNLYLNYILAQVSAFLTFFGWLTTLFVLILRCFIPIDFIVYGRRLYEVERISARERRRVYAQAQQNAISCDDNYSDSASTSVEFLEVYNYGPDVMATATTSFSVSNNSPDKGCSKKLS